MVLRSYLTINKMKNKIINILHHPPDYYTYRNSPRPEINWDTPNGNWVGIWGYDWPDVVGNEVLKITDEFEYEIWQPDLRADKIYSHRFENDLVHKLFPAEKTNRFYGLRKVTEIVSTELMNAISKEKNSIIHINAVNNYLSYLIIKDNNLPYLVQFHSKTKLPAIEKNRIRKNILKNLYYFKINKLLKKRKCYYVYNNSYKKQKFLSISSVGTKRVFMGVDFSEYPKRDKISAKRQLNIPKNKKVILLASRFTPGKQIDKIISIFYKLSNKYDFVLIIAGHGEKKYEEYLNKMAELLIKQKKILFPGYLKGKELLNAYSSSDLFISSSMAEGGPVSVMKALAYETPVMCTRVGGVDDIMAEHGAGILVDPFDYEQWESQLIEILEGKQIKTLNRKIAKEYFHWPNIAKQFVDIYKQLNNV